jgi:lipoate-protein ligase B
VPCGIEYPVGSVAEFYADIQISDVQPLLCAAFTKVFDLQLTQGHISDWLSE